MFANIKHNVDVFAAGAAFGIFALYLGKLAGPVLWQMTKTTAYKTWDAIKGLASKAKFW